MYIHTNQVLVNSRGDLLTIKYISSNNVYSGIIITDKNLTVHQKQYVNPSKCGTIHSIIMLQLCYKTWLINNNVNNLKMYKDKNELQEKQVTMVTKAQCNIVLTHKTHEDY